MNKGDLVKAIAAECDCPQKQVDQILTLFCKAAIDAVAKGEKVTLVGFGTFEPRERRAREGRNPRTGEKMAIPASTIPAFSAGKLFKEAVNF